MHVAHYATAFIEYDPWDHFWCPADIARIICYVNVMIRMLALIHAPIERAL